MSRGAGVWQRAILAALAEDGCNLIRLGGSTRSETSAIMRAARQLERAGRCVVARFWNDERTRLHTYACRPDLVLDGKPVRESSVERVSHGTHSTFPGSLRHVAHDMHRECRTTEGLSLTTIWRMNQEASTGDVPSPPAAKAEEPEPQKASRPACRPTPEEHDRAALMNAQHRLRGVSAQALREMRDWIEARLAADA